MARYRSYHGGTGGSISLTGDPRRWAAEPGLPGIVHVMDPYHGIQRGFDTAETWLANLEEQIQFEGPNTIAGFIIEPVTGTNGILVLPDGYLRGVRDLCDKYGIVMIADEVMSGFGRTGRWFAIDHWNVVPDVISMAKGLTSAYVQLGAVGMRRKIADHFKDKVFYGGLTYNSHTLACAAALATLDVYEQDGLIARAAKMGEHMKARLQELAAKHACVGAVRSIGLFGIVELVRDRKTMEPMAPFNGTSPEMKALSAFFREHGLYTFVRWNSFFTNPPLTITEAEMDEAFGIIDRGLASITSSATA
jgi:taurine--2-oxoglutarate transaminase